MEKKSAIESGCSPLFMQNSDKLQMSNTKKNNPANYEDLFGKAKSWPFILLLILLAFTSFRPDRLLPGGSVLIYLPILIIALLLIIWIPLQGKVLKNTQTIFYFLLILLMIGQLPFVRNYGFAKGTVESKLIYGITTYLFTVQFIDTYARVNLYIRLYTIFGVFLAFLGLSGGRVNIPMLGDENDFCLYVNCLIPFAFFLSQEVKELRKKLFYYGLIAVFIGANVSSFSRGGFVGLVAVGGYLFFQTKKKGFFAILIGVAAVAVISLAPPRYLAEIGTIDTQSYERDTGAQRIMSWSAGWQMFKDHPILGVGVYNYGPCLPEYWEGNTGKINMWGRVAHSLYFTLLPEMGIVGTFFFVGMLWGNFKDHRLICQLEKNKNSLIADSSFSVAEKEKISSGIRTLYFFSHAYSGALVAYLATGVFISVLWYEYFWRLTAFWVLTGNLARKTESMLNSRSELSLK